MDELFFSKFCFVKTMRQKISFTYHGVITGFLVLLLLNCSVWLEMRINTSLVLPIFTLAGFALAFFWRQRISPAASLALQAAVAVLFLAKYGFAAEVLSVMPAILLREGYHLTFLDTRSVNILLVTMIFFGNLSAHDSLPWWPAASSGLRKSLGK